MSDGIYIGMAGAVAQARRLDTIADNLANAQTPGFKAERPAFAAFLPAEGIGDKVYAAAVGTAIDLRPGVTQQTGNPLDLVPEGDAMLAVEAPNGGTAYTRDGRLTVAADGTLLAAGRPLLGDDGKRLVAPPDTTPVLAPDGRLRAGNVELGRIGLFRLEGSPTRLGGSLLGADPAGRVSAAPGGVRIGEIELANATPLEAATELISASRSFDHSMQAIQTYRKLDERTAELGRVR